MFGCIRIYNIFLFCFTAFILPADKKQLYISAPFPPLQIFQNWISGVQIFVMLIECVIN